MIDHRPGCYAGEKCKCGAASRKYLNDPTFHALVHQLSQVMETFRFDINDIQDAVYLADELYQKRKIRK